jgi:TolB-like protein
MFTDIVGYTSLMNTDEAKAFEILRKNRRIQWKLIKKYRGRWLKEMGDGILASFSSTTDAVLCANSIQKACKDINIPLRIGIHLGEVIFEKKDVLGDGVNIASRIQGTTETGGIVVSNAVFRDIKNKEGIHAEFMAELTLKGIDEPVKVYKITGIDDDRIEYKIDTGELLKSRDIKPYVVILGIVVLITAALVIWKYYPEPTETIPENSIAVIPFDYYGVDPDKEYLSDGTWDQLLNQLFKIRDLQVTSKQSMEQYRDSDKTIQEIAQEQKVSYVLEGSFTLVGDRIRLIVQLIRAKDDRHVWSEDFEREWKDIFVIQKEISMAIATGCKAGISPGEVALLESVPTDDIVAYDYYLMGMNFWRQFAFDNQITSNLDSAELYFRKALERDSTYALAYIGLVEVHRLEQNYIGAPNGGYNDSVWVLINKAIMYDENCASAYDLRAWYYYWNRYDTELIFNDLEKVFLLRPNDPENYWANELYGNIYFLRHHDYINSLKYHHRALQCANRVADEKRKAYFLRNLGIRYAQIGFFDKQKSYMEDILEIDKDTVSYLIQMYFMEITRLGNYVEAVNLNKKIYALDSNKDSYLNSMGILNIYLRNFDESYRCFNEFLELQDNPEPLSIPAVELFGYVLLKMGKEEEGVKYINEGVKRYTGGLKNIWSGQDIRLAACYSALEEKEKSLQYLIEFNNSVFPDLRWINYLKWNPLFDNIREESQFKKILASMEEKNAKERERVQAWLEEEGMF